MRTELLFHLAGLLMTAGWAVPSVRAAAPHVDEVPAQTTDGYAVPQLGHDFEFPRDHGSHPEFKIEWWYLTGHLWTSEQRRFGFQATFFRRAGPRPSSSSSSASAVASESSPLPAFGRDQIYLGHMALLDTRTGRFLHQERLHREGWNAGSATNELSVWNGDWTLRMTDAAVETMQLRGSIRGEAEFLLDLMPAKPLVVFGQDGVSRKAAEATASSYYLSFPRLKAEGEVRVGEGRWPVTGQAWMDHEISSSQLGEGQVGWDWAAVQLNDGREIMVYRMRRQDGSTDPYSTLAWVDRNGRVSDIQASEFTWRNLGVWKSPRTRAKYPLPVRLTAVDPETGDMVGYRLQPLERSQELTGTVAGIAYWEGACRVLDESGQEVGSAFVELTGYAESLKERFR